MRFLAPLLSLMLSSAAPVEPGEVAAKAIRLLEAGQAEQARQVIDAAIARRPGDGLLLATQARICWIQGHREMAAAAARQAERVAGRDPATQHTLAIFHAQSGNRGKAAEMETHFANSAQADRAAAGRAALLNFEVGRRDPAIELGERAIKTDDRPEIRHMLARAYEAAGRPDDAIRHYTAFAAQRAHDEGSYSLYGQALLRMGRFTQAVQVLEDGQKKFGQSPQIELALGVAYYAQRRFAEAADRFLRVVVLAPEVPQPYIFLSRMLDQLEPRLPEILARFEAWNRSESRNPYAPLVLGKALVLSGEPARAEMLFRESIRRSDTVWDSHFELAQQLEAARKWPEAAREYERAAALSPRQPAPYYRLARVYDRQGFREKAAAARAEHRRLLQEEKHRGLMAEDLP